MLQMHLRGLSNLCSRAAYINFLTPFHAAYNQAANNQVNTVFHYFLTLWHPG